MTPNKSHAYLGHFRLRWTLHELARILGFKTDSIASTAARKRRDSSTSTAASIPETEILEADPEKAEIVQYLAYGSNLCAETFLDVRGIRPLSSLNVCVPSLRLTFDLPGIPYAEPCFANTAARDANTDATESTVKEVDSEKQRLSPFDVPKHDYHKDHWHKPLVGVLYGLTPADFAHVIATEGGGASYTDIEVPCYPLDATDATIPMNPVTTPVMGHTLFAPASHRPEPGNPPPPPVSQQPLAEQKPINARASRPDESYAQPSARYLKLLTDGAREHNLPKEYQDYLAQIRPYRATTNMQKLGKAVLFGVWGPLMLTMFGLIKVTADKDGHLPAWLAKLMITMFTAVWASYDRVFKERFGDGERTIGE